MLHHYISNATIPFHIQDIPDVPKHIGLLRCGAIRRTYVPGRTSCVFCVDSSVYLVVIKKSYVCTTQKQMRRLHVVRDSIPCKLKILSHRHWSQMKAMVQFKGK